MFAIKHNLLFDKHLYDTNKLKILDNNLTEVTIESTTSVKPRFMIYLIRGQMSKALQEHLFGMKYFIYKGKK